MTSAISYASIDENYPVAGQDNNSQGFRDNFNYIKTALTTASAEITALQDNTAKKNVSNDFNGNLIDNATTNRLYGTVYNVGSINTPTNISITNGEYQTFTVGANLMLTFANWPASGKYARIRVDLKSDGAARTVTFSTTAGGTMKYDNSFPSPFTLPSNAGKNRIIEVWSHNGGSTVYLKYLGEF